MPALLFAGELRTALGLLCRALLSRLTGKRWSHGSASFDAADVCVLDGWPLLDARGHPQGRLRLGTVLIMGTKDDRWVVLAYQTELYDAA